MSRRHKYGFTLVELLVVIAIIGILVALLLPAVQSARESARRAQCVNNLKQMGLALHLYHDQHKTFPPGGITEGPCCSTPSLITWTISILPQLEMQSLFDQYDTNAFNEDPENQFVREARVTMYVCPSDQETDDLLVPESGPASGRGVAYRRGSYRAISGKSLGHPGWWDTHEAVEVAGLSLTWRGPLHTVGTGGLKSERIEDITDGTSQTLMIGERATATHFNRGTFWAYTYGFYNQSTIVPESRQFIPDYDRCVELGESNVCKRGLASMHPNGLNFLLCDGSVTFVSPNQDMNITWSMGTIEGGADERTSELAAN